MAARNRQWTRVCPRSHARAQLTPGRTTPEPDTQFQNWAVSVYNPPGGWVIGKVWGSGPTPVPTAASFPDGSLSVKLLFTAATIDQVPYLKDAYVWEANIHSAIANTSPRKVQNLRLLQIDLAVRDVRADNSTGWVFGTFTYDGDRPGETPWDAWCLSA